ncbi:hypothetical protein B0H13DRAFT_1852490 [Mycena leptocephala]|nr:hypothetical protein B0H13DRAFT_1852490 [Mycena leptocephala]
MHPNSGGLRRAGARLRASKMVVSARICLNLAHLHLALGMRTRSTVLPALYAYAYSESGRHRCSVVVEEAASLFIVGDITVTLLHLHARLLLRFDGGGSVDGGERGGGEEAMHGEILQVRIPRGRGIPPKVRGLEVPKVVKSCDLLLRVSKEICLDCKQQKWLRTFQGRPLKVGRQVLEVYLQGLGGKVEVYLLEVRGFGGRGRGSSPSSSATAKHPTPNTSLLRALDSSNAAPHTNTARPRSSIRTPRIPTHSRVRSGWMYAPSPRGIPSPPARAANDVHRGYDGTPTHTHTTSRSPSRTAGRAHGRCGDEVERLCTFASAIRKTTWRRSNLSPGKASSSSTNTDLHSPRALAPGLFVRVFRTLTQMPNQEDQAAVRMEVVASVSPRHVTINVQRFSCAGVQAFKMHFFSCLLEFLDTNIFLGADDRLALHTDTLVTSSIYFEYECTFNGSIYTAVKSTATKPLNRLPWYTRTDCHGTLIPSVKMAEMHFRAVDPTVDTVHSGMCGRLWLRIFSVPLKEANEVFLRQLYYYAQCRGD